MTTSRGTPSGPRRWKGAKGLLDSTGYQTTLAKYGVAGKSFIVTESGAPRHAPGDALVDRRHERGAA